LTGFSDIVKSALLSIWARFGGLDPLLISLEALNTWSPSLTELIFGDVKLNIFLVEEILSFPPGAHGYSAGLLGQLIFCGDNYYLVALGVCAWVYFCTWVVDSLYHSSDLYLKSFMPLLFVQLLLYTTSGPAQQEVLFTTGSILVAYVLVWAQSRFRRGPQETTITSVRFEAG